MDSNSPISWLWIYQLQVATITTFPLLISVYGGEFIKTGRYPNHQKNPSLFLGCFFFVLYLPIIFSIVALLSILLVLIIRLHLHCVRHPENRFFHGYERLGKTIGSALMFFGNIGMYYYSDKSVGLMFLFLSLAYFSLCVLALVKPYTDFGIFDFFLSASLNQALGLFGLRHVYSWILLCACIFIAWVRYKIEPVEQHIGRGRVLYSQVADETVGDTLC